MGHESIQKYMRPGFPKESKDDSSFRMDIEYVGPFDDLKYSKSGVDTGIVWGDFPGLVRSVLLDPIEGTNRAILSVSIERRFDSSDYPTANAGEETRENFEVDWAVVQRSLYEHPEFRVGGSGAYKLTAEDVSAIEQWKEMPKPEIKKDFKYTTDDLSDWDGSSNLKDLSDNAKKFAEGVNQGIEYWNDYAPVARRVIEYAGGPPPKANAGQKETPKGFPGLPTGYEWIRNADRGLMQGGQATWQRTIEWLGAKKVLVDVDQIFW